jgi:hypothetical protein
VLDERGWHGLDWWRVRGLSYCFRRFFAAATGVFSVVASGRNDETYV